MVKLFSAVLLMGIGFSLHQGGISAHSLPLLVSGVAVAVGGVGVLVSVK